MLQALFPIGSLAVLSLFTTKCISDESSMLYDTRNVNVLHLYIIFVCSEFMKLK